MADHLDRGSEHDPEKYEPSLENLEAFHAEMHGRECGCGGSGFEGFIGAQRTSSASSEARVAARTGFRFLGLLNIFRNLLRRNKKWEGLSPKAETPSEPSAEVSKQGNVIGAVTTFCPTCGERLEIQLLEAHVRSPRGSR